jgi:hypothetical protein
VGFGLAIAVASALTFDYFLVPPYWTLLAKREDWAAFGLFCVVALVACLIFKLAHALAIEVNAHANADLAAGLARLLLRAPDLNTALPATTRHLARVLKLPSATIELSTTAEDERHTAFPLHECADQPGTLIVPACLPKPTLRRLSEQVVPSLEVLLQAARERQSVGDALKASRDELRQVADEPWSRCPRAPRHACRTSPNSSPSPSRTPKATPSSSHPAPASSRPPTRSAAASSATCRTDSSKTSSRSRSTWA